MEKYYDHKAIEAGMQAAWEKSGVFQAPEKPGKEKYYTLCMFPYPSAQGLHVGHPESYTAIDIVARYKRACGLDVLNPIGWDAFGLPAENYAIKQGVHPAETTKQSIETFTRQIKSLGFSFDWSREVNTSSPEYYKWTQWLFLLLYKQGLAYKQKAKVNWCDSCQTVLANEQVIDGNCERCKNQVQQKDLEQWFFKVTQYVEELLSGLDDLDWPDAIKHMQRNWIGKSEGAEIEFVVQVGAENFQSVQQKIKVFTTRPDTLYGATYMVLAPEHELVENLKDQVENGKEVADYVTQAKGKTELQRQEEQKEKTGVELKGVKAINPSNNEEIPIYIADYVLASYGTGAIMAVPAHDERDFEFAKKYNIPILQVVEGGGVEKEQCYVGNGALINSQEFTGMDSEQAKKEITKKVGGELKTQYKIRDWLVSRQRYWGAPIPIVYDPDGNPHPVKEEHLPLELPHDVDFRPKGTSPLGSSKEYQERAEKLYGKGWRFEIDTMDTFVCSSWYFLRYVDANNTSQAFAKDQVNNWLPVDLYIGGAEHAVLHLLYSRFVTKALRDAGLLAFDEPFTKLRNQGMILGEDNQKMSKSRGNVINPDEVVEEYGADTLRLYEMFMGPLEDTKPWSTKGIVGVRRFLEKLWLVVAEWQEHDEPDAISADLERQFHKTLKKVTEDIEQLKCNTAISSMMILVNQMAKEKQFTRELLEKLLVVLSPFAPHIAEQLWQELGHSDQIALASWPQWDEKLTQDDEIELVIQINGKLRAKIPVAADISEDEALALALEQENVSKFIEGKEIRKHIFVPGKLLNIVVS